MQINTPRDGQISIDDQKPFVESNDVTTSDSNVAAFTIEGPEGYVIGIEEGTPVAPEFQTQYRTDNWGSVAVILEDSNGYHTIWSVSRENATSSWQSVSVDISGYDDQFRLMFGNDDAGSNATYTDHGFEFWVDDVLIE